MEGHRDDFAQLEKGAENEIQQRREKNNCEEEGSRGGFSIYIAALDIRDP